MPDIMYEGHPVPHTFYSIMRRIFFKNLAQNKAEKRGLRCMGGGA